MSREEKINKMIEEIKIRRNDEQYSGGPFPIYHIEFDILTEEIERLNNIINESRRILGEYKHFSTPTEEQNSENEDIIDKAYLTLHENLRK